MFIPTPRSLLLVFIGGGAGSVARFAVSILLSRYPISVFPFATLAVNIIGSALAGAALARIPGPLEPMTQAMESLRAFFVIGVLGGFTTFSAFSAETVLLSRASGAVIAGAYVICSVVASLVACGGAYLLLSRG